MSREYTCQVCKKSLPCEYQGDQTKLTIILHPTWTSSSLTVLSQGEHCLPCPTCEQDEHGTVKITHWAQAEIRLHKRLRQHYQRHHQTKLSDAFSPVQSKEFFDDARRLRCELIHGPPLGHAEPPSSPRPGSSSQDPRPPTPSTPETPSRKRARNLSSRESKLIHLPDEFTEWLSNEVSEDSSTTYAGIVRSFLHHQKIHSQEEASIADVWNYDYVKNFLDDKRELAKPSTLYNYLLALLAAQKWSQLEGQFEPTQLIKLKFQSLERQLGRKKAVHVRKVAEEKRKTGIGLHEVRVKILDNTDLLKRYKGYVEKCKKGEVLTQSEYRWATGYAVLSLQASNFKRNGNVAKITHKSAMKRINRALKKRKSCELEVHGATKTGGVEVFCILSRNRLKILRSYGKYIRPFAMGTGQCTSFFLSSIGQTIVQMAPLIKAVGSSAKLPNLTIKDLRSQIETEAALQSDRVDRAEIANHLAHTEATRDRHYLLTDHRRSRKAATQLDQLVNEASPNDSSSDSEGQVEEEIQASDCDTHDGSSEDEESEKSSSPSPPGRTSCHFVGA